MGTVCKIAIVCVALIHLAMVFVRTDLSALLCAISSIVLLTALPRMGPAFRKVTLIFLIVGCSLLLYTKQPLAVWIADINSMTNVIAILAVMQLFTIPIESGNYTAVVQYWLSRAFRRESGLFLFTTCTTHVFASFLLFGTVPVMVSLFGETIKRSVGHYERFMAAAIARGYALVVLWAPGAINLFLVMQATGVDWASLFFPGLLLALIGMVTSCLLESKTILSSEPIPDSLIGDAADSGLTAEEARRKAIHILLVVVGLVGFVLIFEKLRIGSSANRIVLAGLLVSSLWMTRVFKQAKFPVMVAEYWRSGILKTVDIIALFVSMGIFARAVDQAGLLALLQPTVEYYANALGLFSLVLVPVLMILLAVMGLHPFVSIMMFGHVLNGLHLPLSQVTLALCLAMGGCVSYIVSPFGGIVLTLAKFLDCKVADIAFRWNRTFCLIYLLEGIVFVYLWGQFFG